MQDPRQHIYHVGSGPDCSFTSIQNAIDAIPDTGEPWVIEIMPGTYHERVIVHRPNVTLRGTDPDNTVITWSACAKDLDADGKEKGTFLSFSLLTANRDITLENLCVRNDAGSGKIVGQAVAVYAAGDRGIFRNCHLIACQDTLFCGPLMEKVKQEAGPYDYDAETVESVGDSPETTSRLYFEHCYIQGDVDYIFGPYRCWFEQCELHMNACGGWYTAANTPESQPYGMVFHLCHLTGSCPPHLAYLGRPWRRFAMTVFLRCEMDACVVNQGFMDWDENRVVTPRLGEWGTVGACSDLRLRHPSEKRLTDEEAYALTPDTVLSGWHPRGLNSSWLLGHPSVDPDMEHVFAFLEQSLDRYSANPSVSSEYGFLIKACAELYLATGNQKCRTFELSCLEHCIQQMSPVTGKILKDCSFGQFAMLTTLFFASDEAHAPQYDPLIHTCHDELCAVLQECNGTGNPDWLCAAQRFRAAYDRKLGKHQETADIAASFLKVREQLFDPEKQLYRHMRIQDGQPCPVFDAHFAGQILATLVDCLDLMDEQLYEHYRRVINLYREAVLGILRYADPDTGMFPRSLDQPLCAGNTLETTGNCLILYAILKGIRLGFLDEEVYLPKALISYENLNRSKLYQDGTGAWHLRDVAWPVHQTASAVPEDQTGSCSTPEADHDSIQALGTYFMATAEYMRRHK